jgi:chromosome segregation ATPase
MGNNDNNDVLKKRLDKAVEIFNEQKQTISNLEQQVKDLEFQLSETNKTFDKLTNAYNTLKKENSELELQVNESTIEKNKLLNEINNLKLELGKLAKDPFTNIDTATTAINKQTQDNKNAIALNSNKIQEVYYEYDNMRGIFGNNKSNNTTGLSEDIIFQI